MEVLDKRAASGYVAPEVEVHGKVQGFVPAGDYVLIKRLASITGTDLIARPEVAVELSERGTVIAASAWAKDIPVGAIAKFSKYGAEEITFDDQGTDRYALVRHADVRGWHA